MTMSTLSLRLPESLHESAKALAAREHVSINQLVTLALAEKMSVLMAAAYLGRRALRGDRKKFLRAMRKVASIPPEPYDRLP